MKVTGIVIIKVKGTMFWETAREVRKFTDVSEERSASICTIAASFLLVSYLA
jgi:hypothetical protein